MVEYNYNLSHTNYFVNFSIIRFRVFISVFNGTKIIQLDQETRKL